jgi:hypothetical protein
VALPPDAVAQVERYCESRVSSTLYCADSNGRWWLYDAAAAARDVEPLLAAIDEDATGIFWG